MENSRIADYGTVVTGRTPSSNNPELFGDIYPFITPTDIDSKRTVNTARKLSEEGYKKLYRIILPPRSVCFVCIGATIGKICMTTEYSVTNQQINSIIVDTSRHNSHYVYYVLSTYTEKVASIAGGAATPIVNKTNFENIVVPAPPLPTQRKIAAILSAYDNLIENNLRRIKILEELAQLIYREWFVHFRFPGHEKVKMVDSPLGKIPEGWEIIILGDLISNHIGGGWGQEKQNGKYTEPAWVIRGTDIPNAKLCDISNVPFRYHALSNLKSRSLVTGDIIFEVSGGSKGQPLGRTLLVSSEIFRLFEGHPVICASFCKRIQPNNKKYLSEILFLSLIEGYVSGEIEQYQVQSTGISNFRWSDYLEKVCRRVPPLSLQDKFREIIKPIFSNITVLGLKNHHLRQTRDLLLPKLISGELDVSDLDITLPEEVSA